MSGDDAADDRRNDAKRITDLKLDERSILRRNPDIEHERRVAIFALIEDNHFEPATTYDNGYDGPYHVLLRMEDNRLAIDIKTVANAPLETIVLPLSSLRRVIKEYFLICDSYFKAIRTAAPSRIEAIDMGRRGVHDEGSRLLMERLICVLQIRM